MKKIKLFFTALLVVLISACSSNLSDDSIKTIAFQTDIDCHKCETKLFSNLPHENGITDLKVDVPSKVVTVSFDKKKQTVESIIKLFSELGYKASVK